jgi:tetratricopeptide (TPR) repeat protein
MTRRSQSVTRRPTASSYTAFMDRLARAEEGSRQWTELAAGLVVLRAVDQWLRPTVPRADVYQCALPAAVARVEAIDSESELQTLLREVIDRLRAAIDRGTKATIQSLQSAVVAYGFALELNADWELALEGYMTALRVAPLLPRRMRTRMAADVNWRLAYIHRELGQFTVALRRYRRARALSVAIGWQEGELRADAGESKIIAARGDLPEAERRVQTAVRKAEAYGVPQVHASMLHDLATILGMRGDIAGAVSHCFRAYQLCPVSHAHARLRILADIGFGFFLLGMRDAARATFLEIIHRALDRRLRWIAATNLMELEAESGNASVFEYWRRRLTDEPMIPFVRAEFHLQLGYGKLALGRPDEARAAFEAALGIAAEYRYGRLLIAADDALKKLSRPPERTGAKVQLDASANGDVGEIAGIASALRAEFATS